MTKDIRELEEIEQQLLDIQEKLLKLQKRHTIKDISGDPMTKGLTAAYMVMKARHAVQNTIEEGL